MFKLIKKDPLYIIGLVFLSILTISQSYSLVGQYQESKQEILAEIDKNRDVEEYIVYYSITSQEDNFEIKKDITMVSDSEIFQPIDIEWIDILKCDLFDGVGFRYYSIYETKRLNVNPIKETKPWRYGGDIPKQPAECYIDATVRITTQLGNVKALPVKSNNFTIGLP